jgi:hypothetical protein
MVMDQTVGRTDSQKEETTTMTKYIEVYSVGICHASVCSNASIEETLQHANISNPTGVSPWTLSEDETFSGGEPNPCQCPDREDCKHYLLVC